MMNRILSFVMICALTVIVKPLSAIAQDFEGGWSTEFGIPPVGPDIRCFLEYEGAVLAGGDLTYINGIPQSGRTIAQWDGHRWKTFDGPTNGRVYAMAMDQAGNLIVAGSFTRIGQGTYDHIARRNRETGAWDPMGAGANSDVFALAMHGNQLIAAGWFTRMDGIETHGIAAWNGSSWTFLGPSEVANGVSANVGSVGLINCLATLPTGELVVGGRFSSIAGPSGTLTTENIAQWNGSSWSTMGTGLRTTSAEGVEALIVHGDTLIAGGSLSLPSGGARANLYSWNGTWSPYHGGTVSSTRVTLLSEWNGNLLVGGNGPLDPSGTNMKARGLAILLNAGWENLDEGLLTGNVVSSPIKASIQVTSGELFVGGRFEGTGDGMKWTGPLARWDGTQWHGFGMGVGLGTTSAGGGGVVNIELLDGRPVISGIFSFAGSTSAPGLAVYDSSDPYYWVNELSGDFGSSPPTITLAVGESLFVAGGFTTSVGNHVSMWDGQRYRPLSTGLSSGDEVHAMAYYRGKLYVGGELTSAGGQPASLVACWDPVSRTWSNIGGTDFGSVSALHVFQDKLIAAGSFTSIGGVAANHVAAWDESGWTRLGGDEITGEILTLADWNGNLFAGGKISLPATISGFTIPQSQWVVRWTSDHWVGTGFRESMGEVSTDQFEVDVLASSQGRLIAGGNFSPLKNLAYFWNDRWTPIADGVGNFLGMSQGAQVLALQEWGDHLLVGGLFSTVGQGIPSSGIALVDLPATTPVEFTDLGVATAVDGFGMNIHWAVADPAGAAGFRVNRQGTDGERQVITDWLLETSGRYQVFDNTPSGMETIYWIEELSRDGGVLWHGPLAPESRPVVAPVVPRLTAYPNPATSSVRLAVSGPSGISSLEIFDLSGRQVRRMGPEVSGGAREWDWDLMDDGGRRVSNGIYFVRSSTGGTTVRISVVG